MRFKKRGALELSVNAIVVVVIAFVVLGLALTLTRTIFKGAQDKIPEAIDLTALEAQPTAENPITIASTINLKAKGKLEQNVGFYNKGQNSVVSGEFTIKNCKSEDNTAAPVRIIKQGTLEPNLPTVISPGYSVPVAQSKAYPLIIKENGLSPGFTYICDLVLVDKKGTTVVTDDVDVETKSIFLHIVS